MKLAIVDIMIIDLGFMTLVHLWISYNTILCPVKN